MYRLNRFLIRNHPGGIGMDALMVLVIIMVRNISSDATGNAETLES